ncbi:MAG: isochorismatase family cysteine hydrolase [Chloroflexota bacterium]
MSNVENTFSEKQSGQPKLVQFEPTKTAVLVVDMLNDFFEEGGEMVLEGGDVLYEPHQRLLETARSAGTQVFFLNQWLRPDDSLFQMRTPHCIQGTWGAEIVKALEVKDEDIIVHKRRYSGFTQTSLDMSLRERGITTVIVTGVVTNICVRSTVNDAYFLQYNVIVPRDCVMATSPEAQEVHLYDIDTHYGVVTDLETVLDSFEQFRAEAAPE